MWLCFEDMLSYYLLLLFMMKKLKQRLGTLSLSFRSHPTRCSAAEWRGWEPSWDSTIQQADFEYTSSRLHLLSVIYYCLCSQRYGCWFRVLVEGKGRKRKGIITGTVVVGCCMLLQQLYFQNHFDHRADKHREYEPDVAQAAGKVELRSNLQTSSFLWKNVCDERDISSSCLEC